ncbi:MAG: hypothetical protein P4M07_19380 [Xanthobacteraceae bacterium]|nr:hypothetical protein [Xanthobacteraceae bacterium]
MRRACFAALLLMLASSTMSFAQSPKGDTQPSAASDSDDSMEPLQLGDHWTYEIRDEIAGTVKATIATVVTDITPTDVSIRSETLGTPGFGFLVFDHLWNAKDNSTWKYSPNDGTGIKQPLTAGAAWKFQSNDTFVARGAAFKRSGSSKVIGEESITTRAGTFNAFRIETKYEGRNVADPTRTFQTQLTTWYAPSVDHWVKRTSKTTISGHVNDNTTIELIEFGRR